MLLDIEVDGPMLDQHLQILLSPCWSDIGRVASVQPSNENTAGNVGPTSPKSAQSMDGYRASNVLGYSS